MQVLVSERWRRPSCAGFAVAFASSLAIAGPAFQSIKAEVLPADEVRRVANETIGLTDSLLVNLDLDTTAGQAIAVELPTEDGVLELALFPHSVREPGYQLFVVGEDGVQRAVAPGPERTLRGEVVGVAGSLVAGSMLDDGLYARVALPDGTEYWVEPISDRVYGAARGDHLVYHAFDELNQDRTCGADFIDQPNWQPDIHAIDQHQPSGTQRGGDICEAQLACDADVEYYNDHGNSVSAVENQINSVINSMNSQYENQVGITHVITAIVVRTSNPDPYTTTDAGSLLSQFRNEWLVNQGGIQRDAAQLFTGKNLDGGTIGVAWLGSVCSSLGFSVVESDFTGSFSCKTDLSAHELGHNWGADHCSCTSNTMNPSITCANNFHATFTQPDIVSYKNSILGCLQCGPPQPVFTTVVTVNRKGATITVSGDAAEAQNSDDQYVESVSGLVNGHQRANLTFHMDGSTATVSQIDVKTEVGASTTGTNTHVYVRQFPDNGLPQLWVKLQNYAQPIADTVMTWPNVANPNLYVKDLNGRIHVRIFTNKRNTEINFTQYVDQVEVYSVP
jgi:hypothetical protein